MSDPDPTPVAPRRRPWRAAAVTATRRSVKVTAAAYDLVRPAPRGIVVLIYHRVGRRSTMEVDLPTELFEAQMAELAASGRVISLDRALELLAEPPDSSAGASGDACAASSTISTAGSERPVVLTFDDGTSDLVEIATPVLERHGLPATLYLATGFVEDGVAFPDHGQALSWAGVREMAASAVWQIESHTHRHALLDRLLDGEIDQELDRSIDLIGEHTGRAPAHFAYPKALAGTPAAQHAVRRRFRSAALAGTRPNPYGATDPWHLARTPVQAADGMGWFRRKAAGGLRAEDDLRRLANRLRYASSDE